MSKNNEWQYWVDYRARHITLDFQFDQDGSGHVTFEESIDALKKLRKQAKDQIKQERKFSGQQASREKAKGPKP